MSGNLAVGTAGPQIAFICTAPDHLGTNGAVSDNLTIHEGQWAYCPNDIRAGSHTWKPTGGVGLIEIELSVRGMRQKNGNGHASTKLPDRQSPAR